MIYISRNYLLLLFVILGFILYFFFVFSIRLDVSFVILYFYIVFLLIVIKLRQIFKFQWKKALLELQFYYLHLDYLRKCPLCVTTNDNCNKCIYTILLKQEFLSPRNEKLPRPYLHPCLHFGPTIIYKNAVLLSPSNEKSHQDLIFKQLVEQRVDWIYFVHDFVDFL